MRIDRTAIFLLLLLCISQHSLSQLDSLVYDSPTLKIRQISNHAFVHISFLDTNDYGKVACNGMLVIKDNEAVVLETPINNEVAAELINWIDKDHQAKIHAVIIHHFHEDCLGGLGAFHQRNIPSYANQLTIDSAGREGVGLPIHAIEQGHRTPVADQALQSYYFGPAHTVDNIVSLYQDGQILFGGCMLKALGSKEGNLADANVSEWSQTIRKLKAELPDIQMVIPGHGNKGGPELLDYTIQLFEKY